MKTYVDSINSYAVSLKPGFEFLNETLHDLLKKISTSHPNHVAFVFEQNGGVKITYGDLRARVERCARNLLGLGLRKGDRLALMFPYTLETLVITFACACVGIMAAPIDPWWCTEDLEHTLNKIEPNALVLMSHFDGIFYYRLFREFCPQVASAPKGELVFPEFPHLKHVIVARQFENYPLGVEPDVDYDAHVWDLNEILADNPSLSSRVTEWPDVNPHDSVFMVYTSGTTGKRKASYASFYKYINNTKLHMEVFRSDIKVPDYYANTCYAMSLNFVASQIFAFLPGLLQPIFTVFPGFSRSIESTLSAIQKYGCTSLTAAPKHLFDIFNSASLKTYELGSLKYIGSGSQTVSVDLVQQAFARCKCLDSVLVVYGMTEMLFSAVTRVTAASIKDREMNPVGKPIPFFEFRVVDPDSNSVVPLNTCGELHVKSFSIFDGYWNDSEKTKEAIGEDGWLRTGDLVQMDEQGYIYFKSRRKEVIKFGDMLVIPSEIEVALRTHENVADANVFSITNSSGLDICGCAWVILKDKRKRTTADELRAICGRKVLDYIKFVDDFPMSNNGKVLKTEMSRQFKLELNL